MGVKLFAWLGGLALFLGVAFFIKYSFDNNLVSPQLRDAEMHGIRRPYFHHETRPRGTSPD